MRFVVRSSWRLLVMVCKLVSISSNVWLYSCINEPRARWSIKYYRWFKTGANNGECCVWPNQVQWAWGSYSRRKDPFIWWLCDRRHLQSLRKVKYEINWLINFSYFLRDSKRSLYRDCCHRLARTVQNTTKIAQSKIVGYVILTGCLLSEGVLNWLNRPALSIRPQEIRFGTQMTMKSVSHAIKRSMNLFYSIDSRVKHVDNEAGRKDTLVGLSYSHEKRKLTHDKRNKEKSHYFSISYHFLFCCEGFLRHRRNVSFILIS